MEAGITSWVDYLVIGLYFFFVIAVGMLSLCRKNRETVKGYFLAGRTMTWLPIGASIFASNIGSEHFVGLAGSGAASGIGVVLFEWGGVLLLLLLGWVFLPIYLHAGVFTMPEYLGRRFGGNRMCLYLSVVSVLLYITTKISVDMFSGVFFIQMATGLDMYLAMIPLLLVTALYTLAGGLAAVVFTDALQTVVMLVGAVVLSVLAFVEVGGFSQLYVKYMVAMPHPNTTGQLLNADNLTFLADNLTSILENLTDAITGDHLDTTAANTIFPNSDFINTSRAAGGQCGLPKADAWHMFRDPMGTDLPWPGVVFRVTFAAIWYWCADQVIVQRALAAKNVAHARAATVLAGYLKFTPLFLIIMPGMISRVLYPDIIACNTKESCKLACGNEAGCSNSAYPNLILKLAPVGIKGLLMAVMVAALMSSLTSIFNSAVTVFTMDLWRRGRPRASERELLIVGRLFVLVLVGISIAWIPLIMASQEGQLFMYIMSVTSYLAPPISAIFFLAMFVPRVNEPGAFWGVMCGQCVGIARLVLDFVYPSPACGEPDDRPDVVSKVHFAYFAIVIFTLTVGVALAVSLLTEPQDSQQIKNLTFWSYLKHQNSATSPANSPNEGASWPNKGTANETDDGPLAGARPNSHVGIDTSVHSDNMAAETSPDKTNFRPGSEARVALMNAATGANTGAQTTGSRASLESTFTRGSPGRFSDISHRIALSRDSGVRERLSKVKTQQRASLTEVTADAPERTEGRRPSAVTLEGLDDVIKVMGKYPDFGPGQSMAGTSWLVVGHPWSTVLNVNAVILLCVLAFLCGFFH